MQYDPKDDDPLQVCRRAGEGRVLLYNIWIDAAQLANLNQWIDFPKELTRRLLRTLVGTENLKTMCARGKSSKHRPIPEDILNAVECKLYDTSKIIFLNSSSRFLLMYF